MLILMTSEQLESELYIIAKWARTCTTLTQLDVIQTFYSKKLKHLNSVKKLLPIYTAIGWLNCTITTQRGIIKSMNKLKSNNNHEKSN